MSATAEFGQASTQYATLPYAESYVLTTDPEGRPLDALESMTVLANRLASQRAVVTSTAGYVQHQVVAPAEQRHSLATGRFDSLDHRLAEARVVLMGALRRFDEGVSELQRGREILAAAEQAQRADADNLTGQLLQPQLEALGSEQDFLTELRGDFVDTLGAKYALEHQQDALATRHDELTDLLLAAQATKATATEQRQTQEQRQREEIVKPAEDEHAQLITSLANQVEHAADADERDAALRDVEIESARVLRVPKSPELEEAEQAEQAATGSLAEIEAELAWIERQQQASAQQAAVIRAHIRALAGKLRTLEARVANRGELSDALVPAAHDLQARGEELVHMANKLAEQAQLLAGSAPSSVEIAVVDAPAVPESAKYQASLVEQAAQLHQINQGLPETPEPHERRLLAVVTAEATDDQPDAKPGTESPKIIIHLPADVLAGWPDRQK